MFPRTLTVAAVAALAMAIAMPANAHPVVVSADGLYVVHNHGHSLVLRETNGRTSDGAISYGGLPAVTGAQVHDVCFGAYTDADVGAWQGADRFYAYLPFQTASAGMDDQAVLWLSVWSAKGVDLLAATDLPALCGSLGGTFVEKDEIVAGPLSA